MENPEKTALIAGTFDPVTVGHLDIIRRTAALYDRVFVAVCRNEAKTPLFSEETRLAALAVATRDIANVEVIRGEGLTAEFARKIGADVIVKGVRNEADFAYERDMADYNRSVSGIETLFLPASPDIAVVSSTLVRERLAKNESITDLVPASVLPLLLL